VIIDHFACDILHKASRLYEQSSAGLVIIQPMGTTDPVVFFALVFALTGQSNVT
jgi:hypothetical protein